MTYRKHAFRKEATPGAFLGAGNSREAPRENMWFSISRTGAAKVILTESRLAGSGLKRWSQPYVAASLAPWGHRVTDKHSVRPGHLQLKSNSFEKTYSTCHEEKNGEAPRA